jgi:hypothetical protein
MFDNFQQSYTLVSKLHIYYCCLYFIWWFLGGRNNYMEPARFLRLGIWYSLFEQHLDIVHKKLLCLTTFNKVLCCCQTIFQSLPCILCLMTSKLEKIIIWNELACWGSVSIWASLNSNSVQFIGLVFMSDNFQQSYSLVSKLHYYYCCLYFIWWGQRQKK